MLGKRNLKLLQLLTVKQENQKEKNSETSASN